MNSKPARWIAPLTLLLPMVLCGASFAQSDSTTPRVANTTGFQRSSSDRNDVVVASLFAASAAQPATEADAAAVETPEPASAEPAEPLPAEPSPAEPSPADPPQRAAGRATSHLRLGIGVKISTLGAGIEAATPLGEKFNIRAGFNMLRYSRPISYDGIDYDGQLRFQSAEAHFDWFPIGEFHVSPGILFYNGNEVTATATVPGGQTFSEGGTMYESDPNTPVNGSGKLDFVKVSPSIMVGWGNLVPRNGRHFSFLIEVGGAYQGNAHVALNLAGNVCDTTGANCRAISSDPTVQSSIQAQQVKIQNEINPYRFYPVLSLGIGFSF
jgi:hypothetical protein